MVYYHILGIFIIRGVGGFIIRGRGLMLQAHGMLRFCPKKNPLFGGLGSRSCASCENNTLNPKPYEQALGFRVEGAWDPHTLAAPLNSGHCGAIFPPRHAHRRWCVNVRWREDRCTIAGCCRKTTLGFRCI